MADTEAVTVWVTLTDLVTVAEGVSDAVRDAVLEGVGLGLASTNSIRAVTPVSIIE